MGGALPTPFAAFAEACEAARGIPGKLEKVAIAARLLRSVDAAELAAAARFFAAKPLSELDARALDVGWAIVGAAARGGQRSLLQEPLTIAEVARAFEAIAALSGSDSRRRKEQVLAALLGRCAPAERPWLLAILAGEMRTGIGDGLVLDAIAEAASAPPALVRRAHLLRGDLGEVAELAMAGGAAALRATALRLFHPLRPMLAEMSPGAGEALRELGGEAAFETKFDGARIALHKRGGEVRVFSRRLTDVTESVPEAVELARSLRCSEAVVEGEAVAYAGGKPLPFQDIMRRLTRVHGLEEERARVPLTVHLFDCLHLDGATLLDAPYRERWAALERIAPEAALAPRIVTRDGGEAERFLARALEQGHEGVMAKALGSAYTPGRRGAQWLKVKPSMTLDCAVIGAEWGSGRREGWLSNYNLAVRVREGEEALLQAAAAAPRGDRTTLMPGYAMVGKTFKGLTDAEFAAMTARLRALASEERWWGVVVRPEVVVEVEYNEIQRSPHYASGFALRFARVKAFRDDKRGEEADTLGALVKLYEAQARTKGRLA